MQEKTENNEGIQNNGTFSAGGGWETENLFGVAVLLTFEVRRQAAPCTPIPLQLHS